MSTNHQAQNKIFEKMMHFLPAIVFVCALVIVQNQLQGENINNIVSTLQTTPTWIILVAIVFTLVNYLILAAYDGLALYFTGHTKIPLPKVIAAALLSYAISNNTGHAVAAGGSIRYRFYSKWGVPGWDILKISLFLGVTYLLGAITLGFIGSLLLPLYSANPTQDTQAIYLISGICGVFLLGYWIAIKYWRKPIRYKGFELYLPSVKMTFWQTLVSSVDIVLSSVVLWVLLLGKVDISFSGFVMVFVVAQVAGVISQVPGGIGVFEGSFLWLMSDIQGSDQHTALIGALMLFRVIYFIFPLILAGVGLFGYEVINRNQLTDKQKSLLFRFVYPLVTKAYSCYLIYVGAVLVIFGWSKNPEVLALLDGLIPSALTGLTPLASSLLGLLLTFLARGIRLKIDAAWFGNQCFLIWGMIVSVLNGCNGFEVTFFACLFGLMLPAYSSLRRSSLLQMFHAKHRLVNNSFVVAGTVLYSLLAYADNETDAGIATFLYHESVFNSFWNLHTLIIVPFGYGLWRLASIAPPKIFKKPTPGELAAAQKLLVKSSHTQGYLALLGDKYLFWNAEQSAFIMFEVTAKFWIAVSDPIGEASAFKNLLRDFQAQADHYGAKPVFYRVGTELLPYYLELGLSLYKLGEEARVNLPTFTLKGKQLDAQRNRWNKFNKMGYRFEILSGADLDRSMPCLRRISDAWMRIKNTQEKGFSLGFFDESYLRLTDVAVVKDETGAILAFANLWHTDNREEIAIDLMRYDPNAVKGIMDFLFAELMLWGQAENFQWFSMGLAPLAGLEAYPLAPLWNKVGATLFDMGDKYYNFKGLQEYKAKYAPSWEARYLAAPAGASLPFVMMNITCLVAGGWQGIFSKFSSIKKILQQQIGYIKGLTKKQTAY